ncbi:MAG: DUF2779 domain-containing protein, partial [Gemmatimonadaceae bacterium]|nr:DUF2779 domain-containing protein [Gemmatimonadaceae bacterium]
MPTLSKSDFKAARDCVTKLYYREHGYPTTLDEDPYLQLLADGGYMVEMLAKLRFPDGVTLPSDHRRTRDNWEATRAAISAGDGTWFEATLLHGVLAARVDILQRRGNVFDLIEVKSKSINSDQVAARLEKGAPTPFRGTRRPFGILSDWEPYLADLAFQMYVLSNIMPGATIRPWLMVVDTAKRTTIDRLWAQFDMRRGPEDASGRRPLTVTFTGDPVAAREDDFLTKLDADEEARELLPRIAEEAKALAALLPETGPVRQQRPIDWSCAHCEFSRTGEDGRNGFAECWGPLADPRPEIFDLFSFGTVKVDGERVADRLIADGRVTLDDVDPAWLVKRDGTVGAVNQRQLMQLEHQRARRVYVAESLGPSIRAWTYPLHFIDFETSALAVPYHADMAPYELVAFQWSCHTIEAPGAAPRHREWLNVTDAWPSAEFARTLREVVGDQGTPLMWSTHERTVLRKIGEQLARYGHDDASLIDWCARMGDQETGRLVDMHALCRGGYFHPAMKGK